MDKKVKIIIWVLLGLLLAAAVYIFVLGKKSVGKPPATPAPSGGANPPAPVTNDNAQTSGIDTSQPAPPASVTINGLQPLANIFAGQDITNVYDSCDATSGALGNIIQTFNKGDWMGTYIDSSPVCVHISMQNYTTVWPFPAFKSGTTDGYILVNNPVYGCNKNGTDNNGKPCKWISS